MYNPKIYIRNYGAPDHRLLAFYGPFAFDLSDADLRRALIIHAENRVVGEEFLLLSGDQQSAGDVLDLTGVGNDLLVLTNQVAMRFFGSDVALQYSNVSEFPSWSYDLTFNVADLRRALITQADPTSFALSASEGGMARSLLMAAEAAAYALVGNSATFTLGNIMVAEPASLALIGTDSALLRQLPMAAAPATFAWSGLDGSLIRTLFMSASATTFAFTFNDASASTDSIEELSGDEQSGGDLTLLSGDQQTDEDFLLISQ